MFYFARVKRTVLLFLWSVMMLLSINAAGNDTLPPVMKCPKNIKIDCDPGKIYATVVYTRPTATKNGVSVPVKLVQGMESGGNFPVGVNMVRFEAVDESGNKAVCAFTITVGCDDFTMNCPQNIRVKNDPDKCGAVVSYSPPYSVGNSTQVVIKQTSGLTSGSLFAVGETENTFVGTWKGITRQCAFKVIVDDTEPPMVKCPEKIVATADEIGKGTVVNFELDAYDNCGVMPLKFISGLKSGSYFPLGKTTQTIAASDKAGNVKTCSFDIVVQPSKAAPALPKVIGEQLNVGKDSITVNHAPITLNSCDVTLCIYDDAQQDGDSVTIIFNNQIIVDRQLIKVLKKNSLKNAFRIPVQLKPEGENFIISKAWNVGSIPPNTLKIDIYEGNISNEKTLREMKPVVSKKLSSRPGSADAILLRCSE